MLRRDQETTVELSSPESGGTNTHSERLICRQPQNINNLVQLYKDAHQETTVAKQTTTRSSSRS